MTIIEIKEQVYWENGEWYDLVIHTLGYYFVTKEGKKMDEYKTAEVMAFANETDLFNC